MEQVESIQANKRFVLVCQGLFCQGRGSRKILEELKRCQEAGELPEDVTVEPYYCFNGCSHGPNVVCHPDRIWFERVRNSNFSQVLDYIIKGDLPTDPDLTQRRVIEVVRTAAYKLLEKEYGQVSDNQF